jgi:predicted Zn-dependent protease
MRCPTWPALLLLGAACAANPVTGNPEVPLVSESREIAMGRDADQYLSATGRIYRDMELERYVDDLGKLLAAKSDRPGLPWTFRVLDDPGVNAFALPGGFVYITRGMLALLNSEAQLAAVLGHEIGHVAARHNTSKLTAGQVASAGLAAASLATANPMGLTGVAELQLLGLGHSREQEQQADALGLRYMSDAGYDPTEVLGVLRTLDRAFGGSALPEWLATHPSTEHRLENARDEVASLRASGQRVNREPYLDRLDGLVIGRDWRRGYFERNWLVVPAAAYQVTFPVGWRYGKGDWAFMGASPGEEAILEVAAARQPTADSAARVFLTKWAKAKIPPVHDTVNGLPVVTASFSLLPLWEKVRGSVIFIEYRGMVYRMVGYTRNRDWSTYQPVLDSALHTFKPLGEARARHVQPMRLSLVSLRQPTSLAALSRERVSPVDSTVIALMNQVPVDSVLSAGVRVKWIVGTPFR